MINNPESKKQPVENIAWQHPRCLLQIPEQPMPEAKPDPIDFFDDP